MVEVLKDEKHAKIVFSNRLDATNSNEATELLKGELESITKSIILDVSKLEYISSAGLQVILLCAKSMNAISKTTYLYGAKDDVLEIFQISGFLTFITIIEDLDEV